MFDLTYLAPFNPARPAGRGPHRPRPEHLTRVSVHCALWATPPPNLPAGGL